MELWNWYINLFSNEDDKVKVAAWAATIGTLGFLLTFVFIPIYTALKKEIEKLHLDIGIEHHVVPGIRVHFMPPVLYCRIINRSSNPVYIRKPSLCFSKAIGNRNTYTSITISGKFPLKLEPGQQYEDKYEILELSQQVFEGYNLNGIDVRFAVTTTTGKKYFSKNKQAILLKGQLELAQQQNIKK